MRNEPFERPVVLAAEGQRRMDGDTLAHLQALMVPALVIRDWRCREPAASEYGAELGGWFERAAGWLRAPGNAESLLKHLPRPPNVPEPLRSWHRVLDQDIRAFVILAAASAEPDRNLLPQEMSHAAD